MAFSKIFIAAVAVFSLATSVVAASVAAAWDESKFEPYDIYHARYHALACKTKHNTKFFDTCCVPLAHGQKLSTRPDQCDPAKTQADDGNGSTYEGHGTWYNQDNTAGACGKKHPDSALIGAMNFHFYGSLDKVSSTCGKHVEITNKKNGKKVNIVIADACPSCKTKGDIDLSRGAFKALESDFGVGVLRISWKYVS